MYYDTLEIVTKIINGELPSGTRIEDDMGSCYIIEKDADGYIYILDMFTDEEACASILLNDMTKYRIVSKNEIEMFE